jgi:CRP-like cAMP-binding protein
MAISTKLAVPTKLTFDPQAFNSKYGGVSIYKYKENHIIYAQGNAVDAISYILNGKVKLTVLCRKGKERVVAILEAGNFCGEVCLTNQPLCVSSATATAMTECVIVRLEKEAITRALHHDCPFFKFFVSFLLARNVRMMEDLIDQLFNSCELRLARILLRLANENCEKDNQHELFIPKINQLTLAKMVGTTRSRVNYFMNKFRRLGFIEYEYNGCIKVHNSLLSVVLHDQSEINAH